MSDAVKEAIAKREAARKPKPKAKAEPKPKPAEDKAES